MDFINKNKEEIEKIRCKEYCYCGQYDDSTQELHLCSSCQRVRQERIKTSILWCEDEIEHLIESIEQVISFVKLNTPNIEDKYISVNCLSNMTRRHNNLEAHLTWLKEQEKNND